MVGVAIVIALLVACAKAPTAHRPSTVVERFYATYLAGRQGGLPSGRELERLEPFLSDNLNRLIIAALQYRARYIASHLDEPSPAGPPVIYKPPFIDGDYFSSLFEGPKSFKVGHAVAGGNGVWRVPVHFAYDPSVTGWEDVIIVIEQRGEYVIDDVLYGGAGPFNRSGRLSDSLKQREGDSLKQREGQ
jgi:hypothetical protein